MLFISHDLGGVSAVASRVLVLDGGRVCEHGTLAAVLGDPSYEVIRRLVAASPSLSVEPAARHRGGATAAPDISRRSRGAGRMTNPARPARRRVRRRRQTPCLELHACHTLPESAVPARWPGFPGVGGRGARGNPVRVRDCPAAVYENERDHPARDP